MKKSTLFLTLFLSISSFADIGLDFQHETLIESKVFAITGADADHEIRHTDTDLHNEVLLKLEKDARRDVLINGEELDYWESHETTWEEIEEELRYDYRDGDGDAEWDEESIESLRDSLPEGHIHAKSMFVESNYWGGTGYTLYHLIYDDLNNIGYKIRRFQYAE